MLFNNRLQQTQNQVIDHEDEILELERRIAQRRAEITEMQAHTQTTQTAEQAWESVLTQIDTAIALTVIAQASTPEALSSITSLEDLIAVAKTAIDARFTAPLPRLDEIKQPESPTPEPHTIPDAPTDIEATVVEVDSVKVVSTETPVSREEEVTAGLAVTDNGNGRMSSSLAELSQLMRLKRPQLTKLYGELFPDGKATAVMMNKLQLANALHGTVTMKDIEALS